MDVDRKREFIADDLWLFVAIVTLPVAGIANTVGLEFVTELTAIIGWFLLTPIFLFWGDHIAAYLYGEPDGEPPDVDAIETLKLRYANDEIDDEEFERRLDQLLDTEEQSIESARET